MNTRLRKIMLSVVALAALTVPWVGTSSGAAMADPVCSNGTNWDNLLQACR